MRWLWITFTVLSAVALAQACQSERDHRLGGAYYPPPTDTGAGGAYIDAGQSDGPPSPDADPLCGNEIHAVNADTPNLYFVLDRSGSMSTLEAPDYDSRYYLVRQATLDLLRALGPLINVGAAVFPLGNIDVNPCTDGDEVFAVTQGDPVSAVDGPTTEAFAYAIDREPKGGTPIAATLQTIQPKLAALSGRSFVLLATDGGPNCNYEASCDIDECMANIDGWCPPTENCCLPGGQAGPENCIDRTATVAAIEAIAALGIDVYVIGIPGSAVYGDVLDEMAEAGGVPQTGDTKYVKVDDLQTLESVFAEIAAATISCEFLLNDPPEQQGMTNVYLDSQVIPYDADNGWTWQGTDTVVLHGEACQRLKTGQATQVQIVTGCPTEQPK